MGGNSVGQLMIDIGANVARLQQDMGKVQNVVADGAKRIEETMKSITFGFIGFEVLKGIGEHVFELGKHALETGEKFSKLSEQTGVSVETLSAYSVAARLNEKSIDDVAKALGKLSRNMYDAAQGTGASAAAFVSLGINVRDGQGNLKSSDAVMGEVADKFSTLEDGAGKTALAIKIFGKTGAEMIPILNKGSEGLEDLKAKAQSMGLVFSAEAAKQAEELADQLKLLHMRGEGIANQIVSGMVPALKQSTDALETLLKGSDNYQGTIDALSASVKNAVDLFLQLSAVWAGVKAVASGLFWAVSALAWLMEGEGKKAAEDYGRAQKALVDDLMVDLERLGAAQKKLYEEQEKRTESHEKSAKKKVPMPAGAEQLAQIRAMMDIALKAGEALQGMRDKFAELGMEGAGDTLGLALAKNQAELNKEAANINKELADIDARRKEMRAKGNTAGIAYLNQAEVDVAARTEWAIRVKAAQDGLAKIAELRKSIDAKQQLAALVGDRRAEIDAQIEGLRNDYQRTQNLEEQRLILEKIRRLEDERNAPIKAGAVSALENYAKNATNTYAQIENATTKMLNHTEDAFVELFQKGSVNFANLTDAIIKDLIRMQVQMSITGPMATAFKDAGGGAGLLSMFSGLFKSANGNAFVNGMPVSAFANGGVVNTPTIFPFASGIGLMGEAGPEAIMPLSRGADGKLGVVAQGGGQKGGAVKVTLHNEGGQQMQVSDASASFDAEGWVLDVWMNAVQTNRKGVRTILTGN